jgi:hypothetical protein
MDPAATPSKKWMTLALTRPMRPLLCLFEWIRACKSEAGLLKLRAIPSPAPVPRPSHATESHALTELFMRHPPARWSFPHLHCIERALFTDPCNGLDGVSLDSLELAIEELESLTCLRRHRRLLLLHFKLRRKVDECHARAQAAAYGARLHWRTDPCAEVSARPPAGERRVPGNP